MRFITAKQNIHFLESGEEYILNPVTYPHVNLHDILVGEEGYVYRTLKMCPDVQEVTFDARKIPGFPERVNGVSEIRGGGKLIIMRVGGIGDLVMLTPVLNYIRRQVPRDVEVTLCTFRNVHDLFRGNGVVDHVISAPIRLSHLLEYDYILEFVKTENEKRFSTLHMTDYYFQAIGVDYHKVDDRGKSPLLSPSIASEEKITTLFEQWRSYPYQGIALMSLISTSRLRDLPVCHFAYIVRKFSDVLFVVPYQDPKVLRGKLEDLQEKNVICLDTSRSLKDYMTAIRCSDLVISPDSSAYHLAAAFGKPAIAFFGSIDPRLRVRYYPTVTPITSSYKGEFCKSPCGISSERWVNLADEAGAEILRRRLYDPEKGCVEAVRLKTAYSPCLLAISKEKVAHSLDQALEKILFSGKGGRVPQENHKKGECPALFGHENMKEANKKRQGIKISACMMVKNEEKHLPQCLKSIRDAVDEIIIVDTGSTDRTVEIAQEFGARVYDHPWEDNFSKHRNQSLSYATGDWILIIDADEELDAFSKEILRKAVQEAISPMIAVMVRNFVHQENVTTGGLSVRLFKNELGVHYTGIVHNQLKSIAKPQYFPITIWHYGYNLDEAQMKAKQERSLNLLLKQARMTPEDYMTHHHMAITYFAMQDWENALISGKKALTLAEKGEIKGIGWTDFIVSFSLEKLGQTDAAIKMASEGIQKFPKSVDLHHLMSWLSVKKGDFENGLSHGRRYFELKEEYEKNPAAFGLEIFEMDKKEADIYQAMGIAHYSLGAKERALSSFMSAENSMKENRKAKLGQIGRFYLSHREYEHGLHFLHAIGFDGAVFDKNLLYVPQCLEEMGRSTEARNYYDRLETMYPCEWEPLFNKGLFLLRRGENMVAAGVFERAHHLCPENAHVLVNWGYVLTLFGEWASAEEKYVKALKREPHHPHGILNLGLLHYQRGNFESALPFLKKAQGDHPDHIYAALALSHVLILKGEIEEAVAQCGILLRHLGLRDQFTLESIKELGDLYHLISRVLLAKQDFPSHEVACRIRHLLANDDPISPVELSEEHFQMNQSVTWE